MARFLRDFAVAQGKPVGVGRRQEQVSTDIAFAGLRLAFTRVEGFTTDIVAFVGVGIGTAQLQAHQPGNQRAAGKQLGVVLVFVVVVLRKHLLAANGARPFA